MGQVLSLSFDNYTFAGDAAVIAICLVIVNLLTTSYVSRTLSLRIFMNIIAAIAIAAMLNIAYHALLGQNSAAYSRLVYALRIAYQAFLFEIFFLFVLYTTQVSGMEHRKARMAVVAATLLLLALIGGDIISTFCLGVRPGRDGTVKHSLHLFMVGYVLFFLLIVVIMNQARTLVYKRVMYGFYGTIAIAVTVRAFQFMTDQNSLTTMTFLLPAIAMLYIMHSNPYNVTLGAVDIRAMEDMVCNMYAKKAPFVFLSLLLPEYDDEGTQIPEEIRAVIRKFTGDYFKGSVLFQVGNGHMILIVSKRRNPDYEERTAKILTGFRAQFQRFRKPYKIVIGESIDEISRKNEYVSLIRSIHRSMAENSIHHVCEDDIIRFNRDEYILRELTDIYNRKDMDDPRVLAFCQPVYNIQTGRFDTAEALMRLYLKETGIVSPDQFIPLAESQGYIHVLTEIILYKTCREIRRLTEEGFRLTRISVNVSVLELKDDAFCGDVRQIIRQNSIPGEKVAIELTESHSEADFMIMKEKIEELREQGIQFYLDDFGTGYSNMERIMELPFDIIKFDRSMVIASGTDERSEKIVENLAHMFKDMKYSVLYEGVENPGDEERCREMSASYLQGYMYSRPIPLEQLRHFLENAS